MYDIERDTWSDCPERKSSSENQNGMCVDGKLFLFFGRKRVAPKQIESFIEKFDIQAHIAGQTVEWENIKLRDEQMKLIKCPLMAPISNNEIAFLRFGYKSGT